ncbi:MAG: DUF4339 domain-containing protein [Verrucomicrobiota bacterium]
MEYFVSKDGQQWGPYTEEELRSHVSTHSFSRDELAWHEGAKAWKPIHELITLASAAPPPPAPTVNVVANVTSPRQGRQTGCTGCALFVFIIIIIFSIANIAAILHLEDDGDAGSEEADDPAPHQVINEPIDSL